LERRLEATRKQADLIVELENDVAKAKKQEKVYEDAIEQLQAEQDALEAENAKLRKGGQGAPDRQGTARTGLGDPAKLIGCRKCFNFVRAARHWSRWTGIGSACRAGKFGVDIIPVY
jgi:hypothetical protein